MMPVGIRPDSAYMRREGPDRESAIVYQTYYECTTISTSPAERDIVRTINPVSLPNRTIR